MKHMHWLGHLFEHKPTHPNYVKKHPGTIKEGNRKVEKIGKLWFPHCSQDIFLLLVICYIFVSILLLLLLLL
jgi:hypothetical protein